MLGYAIRRLLASVVIFFAVTVGTFIIFFVLPATRTTTFGARFHTRQSDQQVFALSGSIGHQYVQFLGNVVHGSLGHSVARHQDVTAIVANAAPVTISLIVGGMILALAMAIPIGILSAVRSRSILDRAATISVLVGISVHPVWIGLMLSYFLGFRLHVMPIAGYCNLRGNQYGCAGPVQWAYHLVLPWLAFAILFAALYTRMVRASIIEALDNDYVRTARAKGASESQVIAGTSCGMRFFPS